MINLRKAVKTIAGVVMSLTLACAAVPVTMASATTYDNCDVDRNGYVETADLIILNRYLYGQYSVSNYNQLDVNKSLTVDAADATCLSSKLTGRIYQAYYYSRANEKDNDTTTNPNIPFSTILGFKPDISASNTASREYKRYSYIDDEELDAYTLTPTVGMLNSGTNSRGIITPDDRYPSQGSENTGIVNIQVKVGNKLGTGTGFIVGDHQIATAAHCIYDATKDTWYPITSITMYGADGNLTDIKLKPVEAHVPEMFADWGNYYYDYALITVEDNLADKEKYNNCIYFSLSNSYNVTETDYKDVPIYITGCPGDAADNDNEKDKQLYSAQGSITDENIDNVFIMHCNVDASGGQSGSPIYTITKQFVNNNVSYVYTVLGIYRGGNTEYNVGPLITKYHLQFYHNNPNANYIIKN